MTVQTKFRYSLKKSLDDINSVKDILSSLEDKNWVDSVDILSNYESEVEQENVICLKIMVVTESADDFTKLDNFLEKKFDWV